MKQLPITSFFQERGSGDCGPVAVRMILDHFGIEKSVSDLKEQMHYDENGTSIYDNGLALLREGLKVTLITANPTVFPKEMQGKLKTRESLLKYLAKYLQTNVSKKTQIKSFQDFVRNKGKVQIEIPVIEHIRKAINDNQLVLALLFGQALGSKEGGFHFVVISGYKKDALFINNPLPDAKGGWFAASDFLYALHSSTCFDVDNGSLLLIGK